MGVIEVKEEIGNAVSQNLGNKTGNAFYNAYSEQTLPIYIDTAYKILKDLVGEMKAREQLNKILTKYNIQTIS